MKIAVTGPTGFVGRALLAHLAERGHVCTALARDASVAATLAAKAVSVEAVDSYLEEIDALVHLAGEPVANHRWDDQTKKRIRDSRVQGTRQLINALARIPVSKRPKTLVVASAIGYYGDRGDDELNEASTLGTGFLADVTSAWENEALFAEKLGVRVVRVRLGVVLGVGGGALQKMRPVILGSGKQWMSWVHMRDVVRAIEFAVTNEKVEGVFNLVAPTPVTNAEFTRAFGAATGAAVILRTPAWVLKSALGEMATMLLDSARVLPLKLRHWGFDFEFSKLREALRDIYPDPLTKKLEVHQFVPRSLEQVFSFFSKAENLETITPPWLNFRITKTSTPVLGENTIIDYALKIHGVPVKWRSRIESWEPERQFVDTQIKGPYKKWHHTHLFKAVSGGTLVSDIVLYRVPGGKLGQLFGGAFVSNDVEKIFKYRQARIGEMFGIKK